MDLVANFEAIQMKNSRPEKSNVKIDLINVLKL